MSSSLIVYTIGFIAQAFFSARILVQWFLSEKRKEVVSPDLFWIFSLAGSILLFIYGWLRDDFAIILGQFITYYVYLWNLSVKGVFNRWPKWMTVTAKLLPLLAVISVANDVDDFALRFFHNDAVRTWLILFGSAGQIIFTLRFVYQWYYSHKLQESKLPMGFWLISIIGSVIIISYAIYRKDPVLIIGQSFGMISYVRNIMLLHKKKKQ